MGSGSGAGTGAEVGQCQGTSAGKQGAGAGQQGFDWPASQHASSGSSSSEKLRCRAQAGDQIGSKLLCCTFPCNACHNPPHTAFP